MTKEYIEAQEEKIIAMEAEIKATSQALSDAKGQKGRFASLAHRDHLGTLQLNLGSLIRAANRLHEDLKWAL